MMLAEVDYPFMNILWSMLIFFVFITWIWMMVMIFSDIFRRHDVSGFGKAAWCLFIIVLPFLGALIYLIAQGDGMAKRNAESARGQQAQMDEYVRTVAGSVGAAAEIEKANQLLASGAISESEFAAIKAKALA
jgi:hypothetical protein